MAQLPEHMLYQVVQKKEEAQAVAYAFLNKKDAPVQYFYKYYGLEDNEVRIAIKYTGLCQSDCLHARCLWHDQVNFPICPGHEVIGVVEEVGSQCTKYKKGDLVGCTPQRDWCDECYDCKKGNNNTCCKFEGLYDPYFGGYSTHIQLKEKAVYRIPAGFKIEVGSPLLCAGLTVFAPIKRNYKPNMTCAVIGIGGLGHLAVQYAAKLGMKVTAFTTSKNREAQIKSFGANDLQSSVDLDELAKNSGKYDLVVNTLFIDNEEVFKAHQRLTAVEGTYVQVGAPPGNTKFKLDYAYITLNQIKVVGSLIGSHSETEEMLQFSVDHNVYPQVETFAFEEFPKAFDKLENGRPQFRCVVNVKDWAEKNGFHK